MRKLILISSIVVIALALLFAGCYPPDCPEPDAKKITASCGTPGTGGMMIGGAAGAVEPGATVTVTDEDGNTAETTADADGGFSLTEADLPVDFDHTIGHTVKVTQDTEGCEESPAVSVPIEF